MDASMHTCMDAYVAALRQGGVLACPTETQMGLLADALDERAVQRVCVLKGRDASAAIGLLVPSLEHAAALTYEGALPPLARRLAEHFWPGPLTLVVRAREGLAAAITRDATIAVRVPGPSAALSLVRALGGPLTATSANLHGQAPLSTEAELRAAFGSGLAGVVPGAPPGGAPSTYVLATGDTPVVLREGALSAAAIGAALEVMHATKS